jgi:hypothetical protein
MTSKKINIGISGLNFQLPIEVLSKEKDEQGRYSICVGRKQAADLIRQYVKHIDPKNKNYSFYCSSESYSGGSSIHGFISKKDGSKVPVAIYEKLDKFANTLRAGTFNGMTDSYDYKSQELTDNGNVLNCYTSYIFMKNDTKFGTVEDALKDLNAGLSIEEVTKYMNESQKKKLEKALKSKK